MVAVEQVLLVEREWLLAHLQLDIPAFDRLMDPGYLQIDAGGDALGKEQVLASFRSVERHWMEAHSDEHHVRVYRNTAVVVGRWQARGTNAGISFDYQARYVAVLSGARQDGEWSATSLPL